MIATFALTQLLNRCAPDVGALTMSALVVHESGARPNAIADDTSHRSYDFASQATAALAANRLLNAGHEIDVGYAQVNSRNFRSLGLSAQTALDPCTNIAAAARILRADYFTAVRQFGPGQAALRHALSAYNTGDSWRGLGYARAVYETAMRFRSQGRNP